MITETVGTRSTLTHDQSTALAEILAAVEPGSRHLLTGYAGSGKTFLMQVLARELHAQRKTVSMTAPTHKAVAVLAAKLRSAGVDGVECRTIHSLLQLRPKTHSDRQIFVRDKRANPVMADVVVIDECSMLGEDMMAHIRRYLPMSFVLFVGDPAQLPPVGEVASQSFATKARSHLDTIVRQDAANPLLDAAHAIRASQGGDLDWSWCRSAKAPPLGVYLPGSSSDDWMRKAFTSPEFAADPDTFRYLAWTNARVAEINAKVRRWRFGNDIPTPLMPGERALIRAPIFSGGAMLFSTNEEADVLDIAADQFSYRVERVGECHSWIATVPSWRVTLLNSAGEKTPVHMIADQRAYNRVIERITDEAADCRDRWHHLHEFKSEMANLQSNYALTIHNSQGSTFRNSFVDVPDIKRRANTNVLETQQLLYVAVTRPTHALMLVGVSS